MSDYCFRCMRPTVDNGVCTACGTPLVQRAPADGDLLPLGARLDEGSVIVGDKLGRGGFGVTYVALDVRGSRVVALKEFLPKYMANRVGLQVIPSADKRQVYEKSQRAFLREAKLIHELEQHPNIVKVLFVITGENNTVYYGMELLQGEDLAHRFRRQNKVMEPEECIRLLAPIIDALVFMHDKGVLHRDISPDNIFLRNDPSAPDGVSPCLIDFGASYTAMADYTSTVPGVQKSGFSPPDQNYEADKQGPYTDVYAFCATLYYLLTGRVPISAMERITHDLTSPRQLNPKIPAALDKAIMKGMEMQTARRIQDMRELREMLRKEFPKAFGKSITGDVPPPKSKLKPQAPAAPTPRPQEAPVIQAVKPSLSPAPTEIRRVNGLRRWLSCIIEWALGYGLPFAFLWKQPLLALVCGFGAQVVINVIMMCLHPPGTLGQKLLGIALEGEGMNPVVGGLYAFLRALPPVELITGIASASGSNVHASEEIFGMHLVPLYEVGAVESHQESVYSEQIAQSDAKAGWILKCVDGALNGHRFTIVDGMVVGRKGTLLVPEDDMLVSSIHCSLHQTPAGWVVRDLNSRNGTHVNDEKLPKGGESAPMHENDKLRVGHETFILIYQQGRN